MEYVNYDSEDRSNGPRPEQPVPPVPLKSMWPESPAMSNEKLISLLLSKIETITTQTGYVSDAINGIQNQEWSGVDEDVAKKAMDSIVDIVRHREDTNKSAINILHQMCESLMPKVGKKSFDPEELKKIGIDFNEIIEHMPPDNQMHLLREMLNM